MFVPSCVCVEVSRDYRLLPPSRRPVLCAFNAPVRPRHHRQGARLRKSFFDADLSYPSKRFGIDQPSTRLDTYSSWNVHGSSITPSTGSSTLAFIGNNKFIVRKALPDDLDAVAAVRASSFSSQVLKDNIAKYQTQQLEDEFKDAVEKRFELKRIEILVALESSPDGLSDRVVGTADVEFMPRRRAVFWDPEELPPRAYVSNMSVLPDYRRNGIGRALLQGAEAIAVQEGVDALYLHVMEDNDAARIAYERSGFTVDKIEQPLLQLLSVPRRIRMFKQAASS